MPKSIRRPCVAAALVAVALALPAPAVRADDLVPPAEEGPKTLLKYTACASALAFAASPGAVLGAVLLCAKTFLDECTP